MTIRDFTHFAEYGRSIYIYKTPDSTDYTILAMGSRKPTQLSVSTDRPIIDSDIAWGIVYRALQHIAEANDSPQEANRYEQKADKKQLEARSRSTKRKMGHIERIKPYNLR